MIREDVAGLFKLAAAETRERIRQDRRRSPERFAPLFRAIEKRLFEPGFNVQAAQRQAGIGHDAQPLDRPISGYLDEHRIRTARRMLELADGRIPTGRIAAAVGFTSFVTWNRTFRRCTDEAPPLVALPREAAVVFDDLTWHRACSGQLSGDGAQTLLARLCDLYPGVLEPPLPAARLLNVEELVPKPARRCGGISDAEARRALKRAAAKPISRLQRDAEGLPRDERAALECVAANLFDEDLGVDFCRERAGIRDTSITTRVHFYTGDTLTGWIERRRIETALGLIAERGFTIRRISEAVGMSYESLLRSFQLLTGARPSDLRETLRKTSGHPAYTLWRRAESGRLSHAEAVRLVAYLRGLRPEIVDRCRPAALAVRTDVRPRDVEAILDLYQALPKDSASVATVDEMLRTHHRYSAAHWYSHWIRDRLRRDALDTAWMEWQQANQDLEALLRLPRDRRSKAVCKDRALQTDAVLWLLVDCVDVRLFQDPAESEHYADLAVEAAEARWRWDRCPKTAGLRALTLALQANSMQRRNELPEASTKFAEVFSVIRGFDVEPWITGRILSLHGYLLGLQGQHRRAQSTLYRAGSLMKRAGDELERLRSVICRALNWFAAGSDPSELFTLCIQRLRRYPFAQNLLHSAHINRLLARLYLADQLTGRNLSEVQALRAALPPASSPFLAVNHQQIDGIIAVLAEQPHAGSQLLRHAASWYEEQELFREAAVCWMQYSWAVFDTDTENAQVSALASYEHMARAGFASHAQNKVAQQIHFEAQRRSLSRDTLRNGILLLAVPKSRARPALSADRASEA